LLSTLSGYEKRFSGSYPYSVMLVGVRDVTDNNIYSNERKCEISGGSGFNIKSESLRISRFNRAHIEALVKQHIEQKFTNEAIDELLEVTDGQPWCVNRICYTAVELCKSKQKEVINKEDIKEATEIVILLNDTHLDILLKSVLSEARVRRVIDLLLIGENPKFSASDEDIAYVEDIGLITKTAEDIKFSNKLYAEVVPRKITELAKNKLSVEKNQLTDWII